MKPESIPLQQPCKGQKAPPNARNELSTHEHIEKQAGRLFLLKIPQFGPRSGGNQKWGDIGGSEAVISNGYYGSYGKIATV